MLCRHDNIWCNFISRKYYVMYSIVYNLKMLHFAIQVNWIASSFPPTVQKLGLEWQRYQSYHIHMILSWDVILVLQAMIKNQGCISCTLWLKGLLLGSQLLSAGGNVADAVEDSKHKVQIMSSTATVSAMGLAVRSGYWIVIIGIVLVWFWVHKAGGLHLES